MRRFKWWIALALFVIGGVALGFFKRRSTWAREAFAAIFRREREAAERIARAREDEERDRVRLAKSWQEADRHRTIANVYKGKANAIRAERDAMLKRISGTIPDAERAKKFNERHGLK